MEETRTAPDILAALVALTNSADGLSFREEAIRNIVGNTNWNVLRQHIDDARAVIALAQVTLPTRSSASAEELAVLRDKADRWDKVKFHR